MRRNEKSHLLSHMPIVVLMAHSRCNCRCAMCDIWKGNRHVEELTADDLAPLLDDMHRLGTRRVVFSGGEALLHSNLWSVCETLQPLRAENTLLTTGILLSRSAEECAKWFSEVIVSLDGPAEVHDEIRNVPGAYAKLAAGIDELRRVDARLAIHARSVIQRSNYHALKQTVDAAMELGLNSISFLPADIASEAFNHPGGWIASDVARVGLSSADVEQFEIVVEDLLAARADLFKRRFITESPAKMRSMVQYFRAHLEDGDFPMVRCNAPWVSVVIEANGDVRPCFFHRHFGNIKNAGLLDILNSDDAVSFRRRLDVSRDATCRKCVCTLNHP